MKRVKSFEEYLSKGIARKITPDKQRAENLLMESKRKYNFLQRTIETMGIEENNANDYIEDCYNILMFIIRAKMLIRGYTSSGQAAHEAEVAFTRNIGCNEAELQFLDQLRYFRNGILYYGKKCDKEYAHIVLEFLEKIYKRLQK